MRSGETTNADHQRHLTLLRAAIADPRAFEPLYGRYAEDVFYFCYRRLGHPEEAADATSQVFVKVLRALPAYTPDPENAGAAFRAWLFRIAGTTVIDIQRRHRPADSLDADGEDILSTATAMAPPQSTANGAFVPSTPVSHRTRRLSEPPMSNRLNIWLSAAIVALMLLGTVGGAWWFGPGKGGPSSDDGIRIAAVTQHGATASPVTTPQAESSAPEPLMDMLSVVPAEMPDPDSGPLIASVYVDVERQLANMGITPEEAATNPLRVIGTSDFAPIAWVSNIFHYSTDEDFVTAIGFNPLTVQQALGTGALPGMLTVLRGDWDADSLIAAWTTAGYTEHLTESGATVWTLGPEGEIDPTHPIQSRMALQLNNVALLDDRILVYAGTMDALELAFDAHSGKVESARDDADMAPLFATVPENTVSLFAYDYPGTRIYNVELIAQNPNIRSKDLETLLAPLQESREAVGAMPKYHGMIVGITSGAWGDASTSATPASVEASSQDVFVRIGAGSEEDAMQIATVIEWRWTTFLSQRYQQPLESVISLTEATADGNTVVLTFDPMENPSIWMNLFLGNDLMVFAVDSEEWRDPGPPMATPED